jgi:hypothetical protein
MSEYVQQVNYLNSIFERSLNRESPLAPQPHMIKTNLFPHQRACLHEMISRVKKSTIIWNNQIVHSKISILGDQNNSGKSLTALAFLAQDNETPINPNTSELDSNSNSYFFSIQPYQVQEEPKIPVNIILVPNHLVYQWKKMIQFHTSLNVFTIDSKSNLSGISDIPLNSIFLVNSRLLKLFKNFSNAKNLTYKYVFIDEATYIYLSANDPIIQAGYIWLITSHWIPLLVKKLFNINLQLTNQEIELNQELRENLEIYKMSYQIYGIISTYIRNYIPFYHDARFSMIIKCSSDFINHSFVKRPEIHETIMCRPSFNINTLISFFNFQGNIDKLEQFLPYIYQDLNIQSFTHNEILTQEFAGDEHQCLARLNDDCSICLESPNNKILTPCCRRIYCALCIFKNYFQRLKCPTCRSELNICNFKIIEQGLPQVNNALKYRDESLVKYLKDNSENRIIVYSTHQNIYYNIKDKLDKCRLTSESLEYSASSNIKKIKNFQDKEYKILFISDILLLNLYGLNFGFVDCVIMVNKIPFFDLKNILLNSVRKGHTSTNPPKAVKIVEFHNIIE